MLESKVNFWVNWHMLAYAAHIITLLSALVIAGCGNTQGYSVPLIRNYSGQDSNGAPYTITLDSSAGTFTLNPGGSTGQITSALSGVLTREHSGFFKLTASATASTSAFNAHAVEIPEISIFIVPEGNDYTPNGCFSSDNPSIVAFNSQPSCASELQTYNVLPVSTLEPPGVLTIGANIALTGPILTLPSTTTPTCTSGLVNGTFSGGATASFQFGSLGEAFLSITSSGVTSNAIAYPQLSASLSSLENKNYIGIFSSNVNGSTTSNCTQYQSASMDGNGNLTLNSIDPDTGTLGTFYASNNGGNNNNTNSGTGVVNNFTVNSSTGTLTAQGGGGGNTLLTGFVYPGSVSTFLYVVNPAGVGTGGTAPYQGIVLQSVPTF